MKYKGIVFDLDHTLFDRYGTYRALGKQFYQRFQHNISPLLTEKEAVELWCTADRKKVHLGWPVILSYGQKIGLFTQAPSIEEYKAFLLPLFCTTAVPFPFTKPTLQTLKNKGYRLGLITNGASEIQRAKIRLLSLESYFDEIMIPSESGMQKPDPEPFLEMANKLGCKPSELLYAGDNPINDVEASRNAGYTPVWVRTTGTWEEGIQRANYEIDTIEELPSLLL